MHKGLKMELYAMDATYAETYMTKLENATPEEKAAALAKFEGAAQPEIYTVDPSTGVAYITISGPMSPEGPSPLERFFGYDGASYSAIIEAAQMAKNDPTVKEVRMLMDTPGGTVAGMDQAYQALLDLGSLKPLSADNMGMIASAGYYLAMAAKRIEAYSPLAMTGSIGVIMAGLDVTEAMSRAGIKRVQVISSNAPNKAADLSTDSGRVILQERADAVERVFIDTIASSRGLSAEHIKSNFGKGGLLIAKDPDPSAPSALSVGMIDAVVNSYAGAESSDMTGMQAGPTTFQDLPIVDQTWDGAAAVQRVRRFLNSTDSPSTRYKEAFFWYNSDEPQNFGSYKLPFADIVGNRLVANIRGVNAANGAMAGARGGVDIPSADRPRVQSHIDRYRDKWQKEQEQNSAKESNMDLNQLKAEFPAVYTAAVEVGVAQERERAEAHLTMGEASGDAKLAMECIRSGAEFNASVNAKYMAASMRTQAVGARAQESVGDVTPAVGSQEEKDAALAKAVALELGVANV